MIAYTLGPGPGETNLLLADVGHVLQLDGYRVCGSVQIDTGREKTHQCDMDLKVLPEGPVIRISQPLGSQASGCRLDPEALEQAVACTSAQLAIGADILLVNKFGKHEAGGRGFRDAIAEAVAADIPVLVGVNAPYLEAFLEFCGEATELAAEREVILDWIGRQTGGAASRDRPPEA